MTRSITVSIEMGMRRSCFVAYKFLLILIFIQAGVVQCNGTWGIDDFTKFFENLVPSAEPCMDLKKAQKVAEFNELLDRQVPAFQKKIDPPDKEGSFQNTHPREVCTKTFLDHVVTEADRKHKNKNHVAQVNEYEAGLLLQLLMPKIM